MAQPQTVSSGSSESTIEEPAPEQYVGVPLSLLGQPPWQWLPLSQEMAAQTPVGTSATGVPRPSAAFYNHFRPNVPGHGYSIECHAQDGVHRLPKRPYRDDGEGQVMLFQTHIDEGRTVIPSLWNLQRVFLNPGSVWRDVPVYEHMLRCLLSSPNNMFECGTMKDLYFFLLHIGPEGRRMVRSICLFNFCSNPYLKKSVALLKQCTSLTRLDFLWCRRCFHCRLYNTDRFYDFVDNARLRHGRPADALAVDCRVTAPDFFCQSCERAQASDGTSASRTGLPENDVGRPQTRRQRHTVELVGPPGEREIRLFRTVKRNVIE